MSPRLARLYFVVQGTAVLAWWLGLLVRPGLRAHFAIRHAPESALLAFALPDLLLLALGALVVGVAPWRARAAPLAWCVAGATLYATLYTLATAAWRASTWLGFALMAPAAILSLLAAATLHRADRRALPASRSGEPGP